jgi:Domain of unknown function (DUF4845)
MKKSQSVANQAGLKQLAFKQQGAGFLSTIIFLTALGCVATIGLKSTPAYLEFWSVQSALKSVAQSAMNHGDDDIRSGFDKHARIDNIESVKSSDLTISNGEVSVAYQKVVPLFSNISLLFDFSASSTD